MAGERFVSRAPALANEATKLRHAVVAYASELGAPESVVQAVRLAVSEALTNAVVHAYVGREPGSMIAEAWCDKRHLVVRIYDEGRGLIPRTNSPGLGVGTPLMASMSDDLRIDNREGTRGTIVSLRFSLNHQG
jgi:serine/threonine-protein kinase RsbW